MKAKTVHPEEAPPEQARSAVSKGFQGPSRRVPPRRHWQLHFPLAPKQVVLALACCAAVLVGFFLPRVPTVLGAAVVSFQELEESLTCQCGCGLTVHACNHLNCPSAGSLRQEIRAQMDLGKSKAEILAYFKGKYGEKILSAPTTTGFNVVAWLMPFVLMILGGLIVAVAIMRWSGRARQESPAEPHPARSASPYDKILEKELKDFEA